MPRFRRCFIDATTPIHLHGASAPFVAETVCAAIALLAFDFARFPVGQGFIVGAAFYCAAFPRRLATKLAVGIDADALLLFALQQENALLSRLMVAIFASVEDLAILPAHADTHDIIAADIQITILRAHIRVRSLARLAYPIFIGSQATPHVIALHRIYGATDRHAIAIVRLAWEIFGIAAVDQFIIAAKRIGA